MIFLYVSIGVFIGMAVIGACWWYCATKVVEETVHIEKEKVDITLQDIIRLAALNTTPDVNSLIIEYKIDRKNPEFYEKYLALSKREKELYFNELITIFSKNRREYVQELFDHHSALSLQDVLLLLMSEAHLDNKTMARILGINAETFKKRKSRLKAKMEIKAKG